MNRPNLLALRISFVYALLGLLWVTFSASFLEFLADDFSSLSRYHTYLGWFFVLLATLPVYLVAHRVLLERERTEEKLRESAERLGLFIEHAPAALAVFDRDMRYLAASNRWISDYGLAGRDIAGVSHYEIIPEIPERWKKIHQRAMTGEVLRAEEDHFVRADGSVQWLEWEIMPWKTAHGEVGGIAIFTEDITARKQFETALCAREARYRAVIETSVEGFWITDLEGKLLEVNDAYIRLSGYSREELLSMRISELEAREGEGSIACRLPGILQSGHDLFETTHRRHDGSVWPVEIAVSYSPSVSGFLFVFALDISKRKKLERELGEKRREMAALQKIQVAAQTAAAFAHELNQPLLAISSYSDASLMLLAANNPDLAKVKKAVEESKFQALRAGQSIRQLMELLSLNEFPTESLDLASEIDFAVAAAGAENELKFTAAIEIEPGLPAVMANHIHVQKVLLNLLNNGIEAMAEAGVQNPAIFISACADGGFAQVKIKDFGPGLGEEDRKRLFEPFFTTKQEGIGMGLAVSRSLIEANGGSLRLEEENGTGACFRLTLPFSN